MEGFKPEADIKLKEAYIMSRQMFNQWIKPFADYRYDSPEKKLTLGDSNYNDKFMCRIISQQAVIIWANLFLTNSKDFSEKEEDLVSKINTTLIDIKLLGDSVRIGKKMPNEKMTEEQLLLLKHYVTIVIDSCAEILERNKDIVPF